jgi:hypothetical protein
VRGKSERKYTDGVGGNLVSRFEIGGGGERVTACARTREGYL